MCESGRYDATAHTISVYSHRWLNDATRDKSQILGTFYFNGAAYFHHWWGDTDTPALWQIETEEGFSLDQLMWELGRLERKALGYRRHGTQSSSRFPVHICGVKPTVS